ncbi:MAG: NAD(P)/FAD-dependent oxidoreductase [Thermodesulfobacteriota bacterium]|nr:NAD(P)/FAD-dependent oxidoreductase [Thermodesulfobacteriota bacterium]
MDKKFDVIIIGAGPNGLEAGVYLSKAGLKVLVLDKRYEIGGGLATDELLLADYLFNTHSIYMMMADYAPIYKDIDFEAYNCRHIHPDVQFALPLSDGRCICLYSDMEKTCESIARISPKDAESYRKLSRIAGMCVDGFIAPATYVPAVPPLDQVRQLQATDLGKMVLEYSEKSPQEIVHEFFEHESVRALMLYVSCMWGLHYDLGGLGYLVLLYLNRASNYRIARGGSHTIASALAKMIHENGGIALGPRRVNEIIIKEGAAQGVVLQDGTTLEAKAVISTIDPHQTFLKLVGEDNLEEDLTEKVKGWQWEDSSLLTMHLCLEERPNFTAAGSDPQVNDALIYILGCETEEDVIKDWDAVHRGEIPEQASFHCSFPSVHDPLQAPPNRCSGLITRAVPYRLKEGKEKWYNIDFQDKIGNQCLDTLKRYAPNMNGDTILQTKVFTPLGIEDKFPSMVEGSYKHGAYLPLQMGYQRPNDECSQHRTPIKNLYVGGSSSYPGGCVIWGAGYLAANAVVEDLKGNKWWSEPDTVAKAKKEGLL